VRRLLHFKVRLLILNFTWLELILRYRCLLGLILSGIVISHYDRLLLELGS
jgi:hypothetical protein